MYVTKAWYKQTQISWSCTSKGQVIGDVLDAYQQQICWIYYWRAQWSPVQVLQKRHLTHDKTQAKGMKTQAKG